MRGQESARANDERTYETLSEVSHTIQATLFAATSNPGTYNINGSTGNTYAVNVSLSGSASLSSSVRFQAVRVFYRLQVKPAPAVATFNDVPTNHAFFPFVEALVASGITSGCSLSPPRDCPDNPVTRGQRAKVPRHCARPALLSVEKGRRRGVLDPGG